MSTTTPSRTHNLPRNVRPSWLRAKADGLASAIATGPKARTGQLAVAIDVRSNGGIVDDLVTVDCLPDRAGETTLVRVTVRGKVVHEERIAQ